MIKKISALCRARTRYCWITRAVLEVLGLLCRIIQQGPVSKVMTPLFNVSLKYQKLLRQINQYFLSASLIFFKENFSVFGYKVVKHLTC